MQGEYEFQVWEDLDNASWFAATWGFQSCLYLVF